VSTDPTTGNCQEGDVFWGKVASKFSELRKADRDFDDWPERDGNAVMNRFKRQIQKNTQLYNSFYARVKEKNKSGTNEADYIKEAASLYLEERGKPFLWSHCIEVLHKIPKLNPLMPDLTGSDDEEGGVNKIGAPMGAGQKRPKGAKAAKAAAKSSSKKKKRDAFSIASIETRKTHSIETVGLASVRIAESNEFRAQQDTLMDQARMYMQLGQQQKSLELMDEMTSNLLAYKEKIRKRELSVPEDISIPSKTESGHKLTEYGKQLYREEMLEDDDEEEEDEEEDENEEEDDNEVDETDDEEDTISKAQKDGTPV
jgi:hypothetical protein